MADRTVHYEAAFEAFLRLKAIPYVAVDEAKKALFASARLKSFDFVVYSKKGPNLLVDVKGRSCRNRAARSGFETWTTERDVDDLLQWEQVFGEGKVRDYFGPITSKKPGSKTIEAKNKLDAARTLLDELEVLEAAPGRDSEKLVRGAQLRVEARSRTPNFDHMSLVPWPPERDGRTPMFTRKPQALAGSLLLVPFLFAAAPIGAS